MVPLRDRRSGRGRGLLRLVEEDGERRAFTFLDHALRAQGPRGAAQRAPAARRRARRRQAAARRGSSAARRRPRASAAPPSPTSWSSAAGRAASRSAPGCASSAYRAWSSTSTRGPGDQWRNRYKSLCLHDPVWYDHLPYLKFPDNWPVFAPKDKIGDWLESYTKIMEVPYWSSTTATSASYSEETGEWTVEVEREGRPLTLRPTQLVFATGMSGKPNIPDVPGMDVFEGDLHHSSAHPGPDAYRGKKVVVIGSNNSAFDICGALWENDVDVTMVQRSSTHIVKSDSLMEIGLGDLYSERAVEAGVTTEKADLIFASLPYRILHTFQIPAYEAMAEKDKDFYERLEAAGFDHDWGDDGSGLFMKYLRRGSGYYIDVGAADLVANGDVKLVKGQIDHLTADAVVLDGRHRAAGRRGRDGHRLRVDERLGGRPHRPGDRRPAGQGVGPGLRHHQGPRSVGGRAAQHVEADPDREPLDARRQPPPVTPLLALPRAAAQGAVRGHRHPGLRAAGGAPHELTPRAGSVRRQRVARTDPVGARAGEQDEGQHAGDDRAARPRPRRRRAPGRCRPA